MYQAADTFVLVIALRIMRGQVNRHNSMLVNASRFTKPETASGSVQSQIRNLIHEHMEDLKRQIRFNYNLTSEKALENKTMNRLYQIWDSEFNAGEFSWEEIQSVLNDAASPVKVIEINSRSNDTLDYESYNQDGLNVIAVGGFSLSRGLTLEGLSVSYFLRNSIMYDTLMQMGRWFGYRPGYEDLCRVYMPKLAAGWYAHISEVTEELRGEFRVMEQANLTPKDFGLKIRSHPDSLIVTARNKMRSGETVYRMINLSERLIETDKLFREREKRELNRKVFSVLMANLLKHKQPEKTLNSSNYLWKEVPVETVLEFINAFNNHPASLRTQTGPVTEYITRRKNDELKLWDVAIINKAKAGPEDSEEPVKGIVIGWQERSAGQKSDLPGNCIFIGEKARVGQSVDEKEGLSDKEIGKAEDNYESNPDKPKKITGQYYRQVRSRPLLMLHLLKIIEKNTGDTICKGDVAYGISFPKSICTASPVKYVVNTTWWKSEFGDDDLEGDEDE
ncbi:MAG: Z1 domain-containing protein [Desulfurivibrio sp.]|nr:Z1 domain-containing protein [Desulfurivibrio sp.]